MTEFLPGGARVGRNPALAGPPHAA